MTVFKRGRQRGQTVIIAAFMLPVLLGVVGLAVDAFQDYYWAARCQSAASAAALAGVVFMPTRFDPQPDGQDAVDRAIGQVVSNGFDVPPRSLTPSGAPPNAYRSSVMTVERVPTSVHELKVTVTYVVPTTFMNVLGIHSVTITRQATAVFLPAVELGQNSTRIGAMAGEIGQDNNPNAGFVLMSLGWDMPREGGDPFTPNPLSNSAGPDIHELNALNGTDNTDPDLPDRGGWSYAATLKAPGRFQVYNAGPNVNSAAPFYPGGPIGTFNLCDNQVAPTCGNPNLGPLYYDTPTSASVVYTLFREPVQFSGQHEQELSKVRVDPFTVTTTSPGTPPHYSIPNSADQWDQTYTPLPGYRPGEPDSMRIYRSWFDPAANVTVSPTADHGLVTYLPGPGHGAQPYAVDAQHPMGNPVLPPGQYRLRLDVISSTAPNPPRKTDFTPASIQKQYAVRVIGPAEEDCTGNCLVSAVKEMCIQTARVTNAIKSPIFRLPAEYASANLGVFFYDVGDSNAGAHIDIDVLSDFPNANPANNPNDPFQVPGIGIFSLGTFRGGTKTPSALDQPGIAHFIAADPSVLTDPQRRGRRFNSQWVEIEIPVPSTYAPKTPAEEVWSMRYNSRNVTSPVDILTIAVTGTGNAVKIVGEG